MESNRQQNRPEAGGDATAERNRRWIIALTVVLMGLPVALGILRLLGYI